MGTGKSNGCLSEQEDACQHSATEDDIADLRRNLRRLGRELEVWRSIAKIGGLIIRTSIFLVIEYLLSEL